MFIDIDVTKTKLERRPLRVLLFPPSSQIVSNGRHVE